MKGPDAMHPDALDRYSKKFHEEATKLQGGKKKQSQMSSAHHNPDYSRPDPKNPNPERDPKKGKITMSTTNKGDPTDKDKTPLHGGYNHAKQEEDRKQEQSCTHTQGGRCSEGGTTHNWQDPHEGTSQVSSYGTVSSPRENSKPTK